MDHDYTSSAISFGMDIDVDRANGTGGAVYGINVDAGNRNTTSTGNTYGIDVYAYKTAASATTYGVYARHAGNATSEWAFYGVGSSYASSGTWQTSDQKFKTNIQDLNSSLAKIMLLPVKTYDFKNKEYAHMNLPEGNQAGIMAQDLETIYPSLVKMAVQPAMDSTEQDDMKNNGYLPEAGKSEVVFKAVNYTGLVPHLVKATQEQQAIIEQQKKDMDALKKQMAEQQKLLLELKAQMAKNNKG